MIKVLEIIAGSWPIAMMVVASMVAAVVLYLIHWFKKADSEDKASRASQAVVVRNRETDR